MYLDYGATGLHEAPPHPAVPVPAIPARRANYIKNRSSDAVDLNSDFPLLPRALASTSATMRLATTTGHGRLQSYHIIRQRTRTSVKPPPPLPCILGSFLQSTPHTTRPP